MARLVDIEWPDERVERLKALYQQTLPRLSLSEIAKALGVSKSAVTGKVRRLKLADRGAPPALKSAGPRRRARQPAPAASMNPPARESVESRGNTPPEAMNPPPPESPEPIPRARPGTGCIWPLWGNRERPTHRYCGEPRAPGHLPYCAAHTARARLKVAMKEKETAA